MSLEKIEAEDGGGALELPAQMTPAIAEVLGMPPWEVMPIAHALQAAGRPIKPRYEDEHAAVRFYLLGLAIRFGDQWRKEAVADLQAIRAATKARG